MTPPREPRGSDGSGKVDPAAGMTRKELSEIQQELAFVDPCAPPYIGRLVRICNRLGGEVGRLQAREFRLANLCRETVLCSIPGWLRDKIRAALEQP